MTGEKNSMEDVAEDQAEVLLQQLMHLKSYETPESARMTRNRQNIMREIRNTQAGRRKSLGELIELSMPWLFAEPKYGIAVVFIAFVGLQYLGMNARTPSQSSGIYSAGTSDYVAYDKEAVTITTNRYPRLPGNRPLFETPEDLDRTIVPVGLKNEN